MLVFTISLILNDNTTQFIQSPKILNNIKLNKNLHLLSILLSLVTSAALGTKGAENPLIAVRWAPGSLRAPAPPRPRGQRPHWTPR